MQTQTYQTPTTNNQNQLVAADHNVNLTFLGYEPDELKIIKNSVAKGTTNLELGYFLSVAKSVDLNPLVKEIWCYKDNRGNVIIFAGRDGFRSMAMRHKNFLSLNSMEVYANDHFEVSINDKSEETTVSHKFQAVNRGQLIGAYAIVKLKNGEKIVEYADLLTYKRQSPTWISHTAEMIKKVAEVHALKKLCNIRGIYAEEEFEIKNGQVKTQIIETANGNADNLKTKTLPKKVTKAQITKIRGLLKAKGKTEENMLLAYGREKIEDFADTDAQNIIIMLESAPDANIKALEGKIIKQKTKPNKGKLSKAMEELNAKKTEQNQFISISSEVSEVVNDLLARDPKELSKEQKNLIDDCNTGKFKGELAYPSTFSKQAITTK